ncbi:MAG: hypothetical protein ACQEQ4_10015, partial [Fibrobacterota bacterium]
VTTFHKTSPKITYSYSNINICRSEVYVHYHLQRIFQTDTHPLKKHAAGLASDQNTDITEDIIKQEGCNLSRLRKETCRAGIIEKLVLQEAEGSIGRNTGCWSDSVGGDENPPIPDKKELRSREQHMMDIGMVEKEIQRV